MKSKDYITPPTSPRTREEQRLQREANGLFAPSKDASFKKHAEQFVEDGLNEYDRAKGYITPPTSPRTREEQRLQREANGLFAPSKDASFEKRAGQFVEDGLNAYEKQAEENTTFKR